METQGCVIHSLNSFKTLVTPQNLLRRNLREKNCWINFNNYFFSNHRFFIVEWNSENLKLKPLESIRRVGSNKPICLHRHKTVDRGTPRQVTLIRATKRVLPEMTIQIFRQNVPRPKCHMKERILTCENVKSVDSVTCNLCTRGLLMLFLLLSLREESAYDFSSYREAWARYQNKTTPSPYWVNTYNRHY